jgi:hypothetical protein
MERSGVKSERKWKEGMKIVLKTDSMLYLNMMYCIQTLNMVKNIKNIKENNKKIKKKKNNNREVTIRVGRCEL